MVVYNVTMQVEFSIADDWLRWQQSEQIQEIMRTGLFEEFKMYRLLDLDEEPGPTYAIQYFSSSEEKCRKFLTEFDPLMRKKEFVKWGDKFIGHRTLMELVH